MVHANETPEEVLSKIFNDVSDEENDNIEGIASDDEINIAPSTAFGPDEADDATGAYHRQATMTMQIFPLELHNDVSLPVEISLRSGKST